MHKSKKFLSLLLALVMVCSLTVPVLADEETAAVPYTIPADVSGKLVVIHTNDTHGHDVAVEGETVVAANPDVIFTNVNYMDAPVEEILGREGWAGVSAVQNKEVYYIDNMASSLPDQNIVKAVEQMAQALYPERFGEE